VTYQGHPVITKNLNFSYQNKLALKDVSFELEEGSVTALVGPNGAGKSTLMRCLSGLDVPDSGEIEIAGIDVIKSPREVQNKIGFLFDNFGLYDELNVQDVFIFIGGCHDIKGNALKTRITEVTKSLRLDNILLTKCGALSRGWRQRVGIAMTLLHRPNLLILDEPASGLDPESRSELSTVINELKSQGMNILVSSHILAELEEYCTSMLVIQDGQIVEHVKLVTHESNSKVELSIKLSRELSESEFFTFKNLLPSNAIQSKNSNRYILEIEKNLDMHHQILKSLIENNFPICDFSVNEKSLQSLYLEISKTKVQQ
jgi:ABC-2 type transport system ATP-binding protein